MNKSTLNVAVPSGPTSSCSVNDECVESGWPAGSKHITSTLIGPVTVRFWWKVSSQTNADYLSFSVGGVTWAQISGEVDWQKVSFDLPAGTVTVQGPTGQATTIKARDPRNLDRVAVGDLVEITYTEAVAVSVEKQQQ